MSSIISFSASPSTVTSGSPLNLNTSVSKNGDITFKIRNSEAVTFSNGSTSIGQNVTTGANSLLTSLNGSPGLVKIYAYFNDETGQERNYNVNLI